MEGGLASRAADDRHAAFAEVALDSVTIGEGGREAGGVLWHQAKMGRGWGFGEASASCVPGALKGGLGRGAERAATRLERRGARHVLQDTSRRGRARASAHRDTRRVSDLAITAKAEGRGLEPRCARARRFSSSPDSFASGCVWLYLTTFLEKNTGTFCV